MNKYLLTWTDSKGLNALEFTDIFEARKYVLNLEDDCKDIKIWQIIDEFLDDN